MTDVNVTLGQRTVAVSLETTEVNTSVGAAAGIDGADGREVELQANGTHIQWRYVGDVSWVNIVALSSLKGNTGEKGLTPRGAWDSLTSYVVDDLVTHNGSSYVCTVANQGNNPSDVNFWSLFVSAGIDGTDGNNGADGAAGAAGVDGREVELQKSLTHIQWRYVGDVSWINLVALADITGADGADGVTDHTLLTNIGTNSHTQIDSHISSTSNPHGVTKTQVGLGNVDNTSDLNKPISTATQTALNLKLDASAYNDRFKGKYTTLGALQTAVPTGSDGDYALVDSGIGDNADIYLWDAQEGWVLGSSTSPSTTDALVEGSTNLYFTAARVRDALLTGLSTATNAVISATDSVLSAFGKLQAQITALGTSKADLALANFTNLQVGSKQVAGYEYGSNANGHWQKWYDKDGNLIKVEQSNHSRVTRNNGDVVTFPVAFPDANWYGSLTTHALDRAVFITLSGSITATEFVFGSRVASTAAVASALSSWSAVWYKS